MSPKRLKDSRVVLIVALTSVLACAALPGVGAYADGDPRQVQSLDAGWKFTLGDPANAEQPAFDDSAWRTVSVPHDWSIEGPFDRTNRTGGAGAFLPAGVGWYRKSLALPAADAGRRVFVDFDGVMANSDVWINGHLLGHRPYGYVSFRYELTDQFNFGEGKTNVLVVRADNSKQPASRWYEGAGIYRHVSLVVTDPVHFEQWGNYVGTGIVGGAAWESWVLGQSNMVINQSGRAREVLIRVTVNAPDGKAVGTNDGEPAVVAPGISASFQSTFFLTSPRLWDLDHPNVYHAVVSIVEGDKILDEETIPFGFRTAKFKADTGFWLNGKNIKIKGVCLHGDAGGLGTAVPLAAWERRLTLLKQAGVNAIRTAHNPPSPEFLDLCDRMGFLVMDEMFDCWTVAKNRYDYHLYFNEWSQTDTRDTVRRDRNHPCIVLYSAGNEIHDTPKAELSKTILSGLVKVFHENDPTRPVTQALFRPNASHDYDDGLADLLDVVGQNYRENEILAAHEQNPARKIIGTENTLDRRVWLALRDHPAYAGQFLWTGFDYLGESRQWPVIGAGSGLFDRIGTPRPRAFERQSWWSDRPMVRIARRIAASQATPSDPGYDPLTAREGVFCDWSPKNSAPHDENVEVYSNCGEVELFLNGKSLGAKTRPADDSPRTWQIAFEPGSLKAVGKNDGQIAATDELRSAGPPAKIVLTADRATLADDWDDVSYVEADVTDASGVVIPDAGDLITFKLAGPGVIAAVDNGDNSSHEPFQAAQRQAFQGRCMCILRGNADAGQISLEASAPGLVSASVTIATVPGK